LTTENQRKPTGFWEESDKSTDFQSFVTGRGWIGRTDAQSREHNDPILGLRIGPDCRFATAGGPPSASGEVQCMEENTVPLGQRERQIIDLLLQGCDNSEIARDLHIAERTVKAHFNRMFLRFGIKGGIKRVKLATMLYRRQLWLEKQQTASGPENANSSSFNA
jgi:DNA-binding CsgD family transcriptional regulator